MIFILYHLSSDPNIKYLSPKIPQCAIPERENRSIPRVCLSNSIEGCLKSLDFPCKYFVYTPVDANIPIYQPTTEQVRDAKYTGEVWVLEEIKVKMLGEILAKYTGCFKRHNTGNGRVCIYYYDYEWISKYNDLEII